VWERAGQRESADCFPARRGESLRDFDDGDGAHELLAASTMSFYARSDLLDSNIRGCRPQQPGISLTFRHPIATRLTA
jgi:hypothetical protein